MGVIGIISLFVAFGLSIVLAQETIPFTGESLPLWLTITLTLLLVACIFFAASGL